jgi:hypothetical protein
METPAPSISSKERLEMPMSKDIESNKRPKNSKDALKVVCREMAIFEADGTRGTQLCQAYEYIRNVKPTSVEFESIFSQRQNRDQVAIIS